jgi:hypothetical protein
MGNGEVKMRTDEEIRAMVRNATRLLRVIETGIAEVSRSRLNDLLDDIDTLVAENSRLTAALGEAQRKWRCFYCEFATDNPVEAEAHFGDRDDAGEFKPICKWWARMDDSERRETLQDLSKQVRELQEREEQQTVQMAGISMAANGATHDTAKQGDYGWSVPYADVLLLRRLYESQAKRIEELEKPVTIAEMQELGFEAGHRDDLYDLDDVNSLLAHRAGKEGDAK